MSEDKDTSVIDSVVGAFKARLSHPVSGVFILAWLVCNWRPLFFLAVDDSPAGVRITHSSYYWQWDNLIAWPLIGTFAYLVASPLLAVAVDRYNGRIADKEAERIYSQRLQEIQREAELAHRHLASVVPALESQQQRKVQLEQENKNLMRQRDELQQAIKGIATLTSADWHQHLKHLNYLDEVGMADSAQQDLTAVREQIARIEKLRDLILTHYPDYTVKKKP